MQQHTLILALFSTHIQFFYAITCFIVVIICSRNSGNTHFVYRIFLLICLSVIWLQDKYNERKKEVYNSNRKRQSKPNRPKHSKHQTIIYVCVYVWMYWTACFQIASVFSQLIPYFTRRDVCSIIRGSVNSGVVRLPTLNLWIVSVILFVSWNFVCMESTVSFYERLAVLNKPPRFFKCDVLIIIISSSVFCFPGLTFQMKYLIQPTISCAKHFFILSYNSWIFFYIYTVQK